MIIIVHVISRIIMTISVSQRCLWVFIDNHNGTPSSECWMLWLLIRAYNQQVIASLLVFAAWIENYQNAKHPQISLIFVLFFSSQTIIPCK